MSFTLGAMRSVLGDEPDLGHGAGRRAAAGRGRGPRELTGIVVLALLVLVLIITVMMARSMIMPLRRLRADALDVAGRRLPDMVRELTESTGGAGDLQLEPIGIDSTDEDRRGGPGVRPGAQRGRRLAGEEALLRANLNAMFVNLSRRSQTLIERQLDIIDVA